MYVLKCVGTFWNMHEPMQTRKLGVTSLLLWLQCGCLWGWVPTKHLPVPSANSLIIFRSTLCMDKYLLCWTYSSYLKSVYSSVYIHITVFRWALLNSWDFSFPPFHFLKYSFDFAYDSWKHWEKGAGKRLEARVVLCPTEMQADS